MSIVVYQGLQSHYLESQMMETRTLKLKLSSSPKLFFSQSLETAALHFLVVVPSDCDSKKPDIPISPSSYRFFPTHPPCEKLQGPYVHPSAKHSSSWLSEKSLHLCTENLGSETGSEFIENSIFSSSTCSTSELFIKIIPVKKEQQQMRNRQVCEPKKQFPPPLTTLYGSDSLHLRPYSEDGRVILKATRAPPISRGCFQIDRSNGRVRLSLADSTMRVCRSLNESKQEEDDKIMTEVSNTEEK